MKMIIYGSSTPSYAQRRQQTQQQIQPERIISNGVGGNMRARVPNPNISLKNGFNNGMLFRISSYAPCGSCGGAR